MKLITVFAFALLVVTSAEAAPFILKDVATGTQYTCGAGGNPQDPSCIPTISGFCNSNTNLSRETCFSRATAACRDGVSAQCVTETADYCIRNTNYSRETCFNNGVTACTGATGGIQAIAEGVREATESKLRK